MPVKSIDIGTFVQWSRNSVVVDVRSPAEFEHAHYPGAVNIPLFDDEERKIVGTIYKQQSKQLAIKSGLQFFGPKMVKIIETAERLMAERNQQRTQRLNNESIPENAVLLHCWRGGMRSAGVAWLLDLYGFNVYTLKGGYKTFRQWAHSQFTQPCTLKIIGGYTGSGKTGIIQQLAKSGKKAIDLEGLANHKGSAFGSINMPAQPSQEMFENILALNLHDQHLNTTATHAGEPVIWVEDESQRIGNVMIPQTFWEQMRLAPVFFIDIPFEERLQHIVADYGKGQKDKLLNAIMRIKKKLGGLETKNSVNFLLEDDLKESFRILLNYYDKAYLKSLHNRPATNNTITYVPCNTVTNANAHNLLNVAQLV